MLSAAPVTAPSTSPRASISMVPLLLAGGDLPAPVHQALHDLTLVTSGAAGTGGVGRLCAAALRAAELLMEGFDLTADEVTDLLGLSSGALPEMEALKPAPPVTAARRPRRDAPPLPATPEDRAALALRLQLFLQRVREGRGELPE